MIQKNNESTDFSWYYFVRDKTGLLKKFERFVVKKYIETFEHNGFMFVLHKPVVKLASRKVFVITEQKSGAEAVSGTTLVEVRDKWKNWKSKTDKKTILIAIAKAKGVVNKMQKEWEENQLAS